MDLVPKLRKQLHQSGLGMLSKCGLQFEFRYLQGKKRKPNAFLLCGSATDTAVNTDLNHKINTGELEQDLKVLTDLARDVVEHHPERDNIELVDEDEKGKSISDVIGETKDKAVRLVTAHHGKIAPTMHPLETSRKFSLNMDRWLRKKAKEIHARAEEANNAWLKRTLHQQAAYLNAAARDGFDFVGEMDIVEAETDNPENPYKLLTVRDTKTSKKSPPENTAHESTQLSAYALASQVEYGKLPDMLALDYLVDLKKETKAMTMPTHRDAADTQAYLDRVVRGIVSIRSGVFTPAPDTAWWCSEKWCAYHSICPAVKHKVTIVGNPELVQIKIEESQPLGAE